VRCVIKEREGQMVRMGRRKDRRRRNNQVTQAHGTDARSTSSQKGTVKAGKVGSWERTVRHARQGGHV